MNTTGSKVLPPALVALGMIASIIASVLLMDESHASYISGTILLIMAISSMIGAAEIVDGRKKYAQYLLKAFLAGNAIVWISAIYLDEYQMNIIFMFWTVALMFPSAFFKSWTLPADSNMSQEVHSSAVWIYRILCIAIFAYGVSEIFKTI